MPSTRPARPGPSISRQTFFHRENSVFFSLDLTHSRILHISHHASAYVLRQLRAYLSICFMSSHLFYIFSFFFGIGHWTTDMCFCSPAVEGITQVYSFRGAGGVFLISSFHVVVLHSIRQVVGMYVIVWLPQLGNY